jgi:hypothetical protein
MLKNLEYISLRQFKDYQKWDWEQHESVLFGSKETVIPQAGRGHSLLSDRFVSLVLDAYRLKKISAEKAAKLLRISKQKLLSSPLR